MRDRTRHRPVQGHCVHALEHRQRLAQRPSGQQTTIAHAASIEHGNFHGPWQVHMLQTVIGDHHAAINPTLLKSLAVDLVLMTGKDAVKCSGLTDPRCWVLEVAAEPDPRMIDWLTEVLVGRTTA